jgi:hypothetical protein
MAGFEGGAAGSYFGDPVRRIRALAADIAARPAWNVLMIAQRSDGLDLDELTPPCPASIGSIRFVSEIDALDGLDEDFDLCLVCNRVVDEELLLKRVRERAMAPMVMLWTWDNHHSFRRNLQIAALADLVVPAHAYCAGYLKSPHRVLGGHVPLGSYQWNRTKAAELFDRFRSIDRDNALHGGFVSWRIAPERAELVRALSAGLSEHALRLLDAGGRQKYFARDATSRWQDWAAHKTGLILPFNNDLSTRFFDSLLTGQVPIVPTWCRDFDSVIGEAAARELPVIRLDEASVPAVEAARREAVMRYDAAGADGAYWRHRYALENHHISHRLASICAEIMALGSQDAIVSIETGDGSVGPVLQRG